MKQVDESNSTRGKNKNMTSESNQIDFKQLEAILAVSVDPITNEELCERLEVDAKVIENCLRELDNFYKNTDSGIQLKKTHFGWVLYSNPKYCETVDKFFITGETAKTRLTVPAYEVLTMIAYKQPVTRGEIASVRGVNSDGIVKNLEEKGLIEIAGKNEHSGAITYKTTKLFLEKFSLNSIDDLPELAPHLSKPEREVKDYGQERKALSRQTNVE